MIGPGRCVPQLNVTCSQSLERLRALPDAYLGWLACKELGLARRQDSSGKESFRWSPHREAQDEGTRSLGTAKAISAGLADEGVLAFIVMSPL
jgi:hypothetical protein